MTRSGGHAAAPSMATLVITPDGLGSVRRLLASLQAQTVADRLELVVVTPTACGALDLADAGKPFACSHQVMIDDYDPIAAWSKGALAARAPVVALTEEHCLPDRDWAEHLIAAYRSEPTPAAVGPMLRNANPSSANSWANFLLEYGEWCLDADAGERSHLPGHNGTYRRAFLAARDDLERDIEVETLMHWDATEHGSRFVYEPRARSAHLNHERLLPSVALRAKSGRVFGGLRQERERWSLGRRLAFAAAMPVVAAVRVARLVPVLRSVQPRPPRWTLLSLVLLATVSSGGEAVGAVAGPGEIRRWMNDVEVGRVRFLRAR